MQDELRGGQFCCLNPLLWGPELFGVCGMHLGYQSSAYQYWRLTLSSLRAPGVFTAAPCPGRYCIAGARRFEQVQCQV